jgi:CheY-like chemotaxis protein
VRTGVEACRNNPDIDLILMEIQMPVINGYKATLQIRLFNRDVIIIGSAVIELYSPNLALCRLTGNRFEMPNFSYTRPLAII